MKKLILALIAISALLAGIQVGLWLTDSDEDPAPAIAEQK